jgi:hypothetical protein
VAATITFDGPNKEIRVGYDGPVTNVEASRIYSEWKAWVLAGNAQYLPAFLSSVGGDDLGGGVALSGYYFVNNTDGWTLVHDMFDYQIQVSGDIYPANPAIPFVDPVMDAYSVTWIFQRSAASYITTTSGGVGTPSEVADAVWTELVSNHATYGTMGGMLGLLGKAARNRTVTDPTAGTFTIYDDDDVSVLLTGPLWEDAAGTQAYRGQGAERRDRLS